MDDFKKRVIAESEELDERLKKLDSFIKSDKFATVSQGQRQWMLSQLTAMKLYSRSLHEQVKLI